MHVQLQKVSGGYIDIKGRGTGRGGKFRQYQELYAMFKSLIGKNGLL
jgi:hypothetical protein